MVRRTIYNDRIRDIVCDEQSASSYKPRLRLGRDRLFLNTGSCSISPTLSTLLAGRPVCGAITTTEVVTICTILVCSRAASTLTPTLRRRE